MRPAARLIAALLLAAGPTTAPAALRADAGPDGGGDAGPVELCNGLDDDDDGFTDEDLIGQPCSNSQTDDPNEGICEEGEEHCLEGEWICSANEAMPEICDGEDDDCDGLTDEDLDVECPDGVCVWGQCAEPCEGELLCPEGEVCVEIDGDWLCISDVCNELAEDHLPCVDNPYCCDEGFTPPCTCKALPQLCVDACFGVECPEGFICMPEDGGNCHPLNEGCYWAGCPDGFVCVAGECVDDPCFGVTCGEGEYCNLDGDCAPPCAIDQCPVGCFDGECTADPCDGVLCDPGLSCDGGECVQGDCWGVECEFYQACVAGMCADDPCWNVVCPNCTGCIGGFPEGPDKRWDLFG